jgi:peptide/nickel transport system substrate-binding protein
LVVRARATRQEGDDSLAVPCSTGTRRSSTGPRPRLPAPVVNHPARLRAALIALILVATACADDGGGTGRPAATAPVGAAAAARLTIALPQDRGPVNIFAGGDDRITELVYDKLLAPSPYVAEPQPWLAEEVRQVDPATVEARIRTGVTWHDGQPFTPADVKFTFDYYKTAVTGRFTHHVSDVPTIDSVELVGDSTVRFRCAYPCPDLASITLADLPIIPRHRWEPVPPAQARTVTELPVGTGPYRLVSYSPTSGYRFEANAAYFAGAPTVKELVMPVIPDASATFTALRTGEVDAALRALPPELVEEFRRQPGVAVATTKPLQFTELRMNYRRPPLDEPAFRRAVSLAVDRADLLRTVILGQGRPADRGYPHPDSPWTNPRLSTPTDPAEARRLLDGMGYTDRDGDGMRDRPDGTALSFTVKVNGAEPTHLRSGELVAEHLGAVGIRVEVISLDAGAITQLFNTRDFDLTVSDIGPHGVADPTQFIMSHRSGYLWQAPALPYPEWDGLFERWKATTNVADRTAVLYEMQELFNRQPTSVPLYYADEQWAYRPASFDGWVESPGFGIVHKWSFLPRAAAAGAKAFTREFRGR